MGIKKRRGVDRYGLHTFRFLAGADCPVFVAVPAGVFLLSFLRASPSPHPLLTTDQLLKNFESTFRVVPAPHLLLGERGEGGRLALARFISSSIP